MGHIFINLFVGVSIIFPKVYLLKLQVSSLLKLKKELPYHPAVPLLSIYPEKNPINSKICKHQVFIAALFIISKTWKRSKCPLMSEWMKKLWYVYSKEHGAVIKRMK